MSKKIECCPHCGSTDGLYIKQSLINVPHNFTFQGVSEDNGEMYDNAERIIDGNTVYCRNCGKSICRLSTLEKQWGEPLR